MECYGKRDCHYEKTICTFVKTVNVTYKLWQIMEIDGWHRFDKAKDEVLREQYFDDPLFVTLYDAIENYETKLGGLTPAEVWSEVQDITNRLLRTKRPDKLLSTIRTDLIIRYSCFYSADGIWKVIRESVAAEWSAMMVLCCLMYYILQPVGEAKANRELAKKIALLLNDPVQGTHPLVGFLYAKQREAEEMEENNDNPVPDVNPLQALAECPVPADVSLLYTRMCRVLTFFRAKLEEAKVVNSHYLQKGSGEENLLEEMIKKICQDRELLENFGHPTLAVTKLKDYEILSQSNKKQERAAAGNNYNLKLVCNILGVLLEQEVLTVGSEPLSLLFFRNQKATHFQPAWFKGFGESKSAIPSEAAYQRMVAVICEYKNKKLYNN